MPRNDDTTLTVLRTMAWERAKGELRGMVETIYGNPEKANRLREQIDDFIEKVEDCDLHQ